VDVNTQHPLSKKFRSQSTLGNVILTLFWDSHRPILVHYQERGIVILNENYIEMLCDKLELGLNGQLSELSIFLNAHTLRSESIHCGGSTGFLFSVCNTPVILFVNYSQGH
jgi:hypothetical protein